MPALALALLLSLPSFSHATARSRLDELWRDPSVKNLVAFRLSCRLEDSLDFSLGSTADLANSVANNGHLNQVRALVFAQEHCAEIPGRKKVLRALGEELLRRDPVRLVEAVYLEKTRNLKPIASAENEHWDSVACGDDRCRAERRKYWTEKRSLLSKARVKPEWAETKQKLLQEMPNGN